MKLEVNVTLTPKQIAEAIAALDDEKQAQVFIDLAAIARTWTNGLGFDWQWYTVGRHLRTCSCSTDDARELVKAIADGINTDAGGARAST